MRCNCERRLQRRKRGEGKRRIQGTTEKPVKQELTWLIPHKLNPDAFKRDMHLLRGW